MLRCVRCHKQFSENEQLWFSHCETCRNELYSGVSPADIERRRRERLELAGRAMQGILTHRGDTSMTLVSKAFAIADLMLAEAEKEGQG